MKYYMKTGITETEITGVGTRDFGTSEFSNLKTGTLETGITGGFPSNNTLRILWANHIDSVFETVKLCKLLS
jgi:hypothetical protein